MPRKTKRERLAELLTAAGYPVQAHRINYAQGYYRVTGRYDDTTTKWDCFSHCADGPTAATRHVVSYCTITDCLRHGFTISVSDGLVWVDANTPEAKT